MRQSREQSSKNKIPGISVQEMNEITTRQKHISINCYISLSCSLSMTLRCVKDLCLYLWAGIVIYS